MEEQQKEQAKDKLNSIKSEIEALEVQLALGKAEAVKEFESQKAAFNQKLDEAKVLVDELAEKGKGKVGELKTYMEELQVQLALGKAESVEVYKEQEHKMQEALTAFRAKAKETFEETSQEGETKVKELMSLVEVQSGEFKTKMDMYRVQLALGEKEAREELEKLRKEFITNAREIGAKIDEQIDQLEDKAEDLGEEIAEKFYEMRKSFLDLFK